MTICAHVCVCLCAVPNRVTLSNEFPDLRFVPVDARLQHGRQRWLCLNVPQKTSFQNQQWNEKKHKLSSRSLWEVSHTVCCCNDDEEGRREDDDAKENEERKQNNEKKDNQSIKKRNDVIMMTSLILVIVYLLVNLFFFLFCFLFHQHFFLLFFFCFF